MVKKMEKRRRRSRKVRRKKKRRSKVKKIEQDVEKGKNREEYWIEWVQFEHSIETLFPSNFLVPFAC